MNPATIQVFVAAGCRVAALALVFLFAQVFGGYLLEVIMVQAYAENAGPAVLVFPTVVVVVLHLAVILFLWFKAAWIANWAVRAVTSKAPRTPESEDEESSDTKESDSAAQARLGRAMPLAVMWLGVLFGGILLHTMMLTASGWIRAAQLYRDVGFLFDAAGLIHESALKFILQIPLLALAIFMVVRPVLVARLMTRVVERDQARSDAQDDDDNDEAENGSAENG